MRAIVSVFGPPAQQVSAMTDAVRSESRGLPVEFYLARAERHNPALNAIVVWQIQL
jgi:hypothetical protein